MKPLTAQEAASLVERGLALLRLLHQTERELEEIKKCLRQDAIATAPDEAKLYESPMGTARVTEPLAPQVIFSRTVPLEKVPQHLRKYLKTETKFAGQPPAEIVSEFRELGLVECIAHERRVTFKD